MKLEAEEGKTIMFYQTKMVFKTTLDQTGQTSTTILMTHIPNVGPALHVHPNGPETFYVIEGDYVFTLNGETIAASAGDFVLIPPGVPHKYKSGDNGGRMLVTTPPNIEKYFLHIAEKLQQGPVSREYEYAFAHENGQTFLEHGEHWGHR